MITSIESHVSRTPAGRRARPWTSAWKSAVEHARGVLGARQLAADPVQLVGDPGEHQARPLLLLLLLLLADQPPPGAGPAAAAATSVAGAGRLGAAPRVVLEHPGVLRAAALRGVDDHRALAQRDAREPAGDDVDVVAEHGERPQVDVPRRERAVRRARSGRSRAARAPGRSSAPARLDRGRRWRSSSSLGRRRPDEHALAAGLARRLDHQLVEPLEHVLALLGVRQQVGRHVVEDRLLAQVVADHLRHVVVDRLVVGDAGADRVDDRHVPAR